jgi:hypothetical protein
MFFDNLTSSPASRAWDMNLYAVPDAAVVVSGGWWGASRELRAKSEEQIDTDF